MIPRSHFTTLGDRSLLKLKSCWRGQEESKRMPVVAFRVASRTELGSLGLGRPIQGSEWRYKVYDNDFGEKYQRFERELRRRGQELEKKSIIS